MKKKQENIDEVLLLKVIEDRADDKEISLFREWHDRTVENADLFAQMKKIYQLSSFDNYSTRANWQQVEQKIRTSYNVPDYIELPYAEKSGKIISLNALLRVAAIFILLVGIPFLLKIFVFNPGQLIVSGKELKSKEPYQMADGSLVYLHGDSEISFPKNFGNKNRELSLKGEAFFEIERNENIPFVIATNKTTIKVLGTSFNVFSDLSGQVKVSVVTGVVEFNSGKSGKSIKLRAGEQGIFNPESEEIEKRNISDPNFQSWKTGIFIFKDTPVIEAFDLLGKYYSRDLLYTGDKAKNATITTTFDNQLFEAVLEELNLLLNTKNEIKNDTIIFEHYD